MSGAPPHGRDLGTRRDPAEREPVDPDVDLHLAQHRSETAGRRVRPLLAAVASGGALGAVARHAVTLALPPAPHGFPWDVFAVNTAGCALIGVVMVLHSELPPGGGRVRAAVRHPLTRPFAGVGVLGGFTTFSTYAVGVVRLLEEGRVTVAAAFLVGTPVAALAAVTPAAMGTRALLRRVAGDRGGSGFARRERP